jgi:hypothetical protein
VFNRVRATSSVRWVAAGGLLAAASSASCQQQDKQLWLQVNTNVPLADGVRLTLEQIGRFSDRQDGLYQTEFGGLLSYRALKGVELGFGYRNVGAHNGSTAGEEDRIRQQIVATLGRLTTRLRVDERFSARGSEVAFRVRPLLRYNYPLGRKGMALFASHESFLIPNTTSWGQRRGYERMRNMIGLVLPLGHSASADIGYLNQYRLGRGGAAGQMDHALSLQLTMNLRAVTSPPTHD